NKTSQTAASEVLAWYDNEKNFISGERMERNGVFPNKSYEIPSNASYVIFNFRNEDIDEIQLSYGSTEQPYTPFVGQSTIPLNITLRALPNGVCDTYEDRVITRRVEFEQLTKANNCSGSLFVFQLQNSPVKNGSLL